MSKELVYAIKKAAGTLRQENVRYYQCEVIEQEDGSSYNSEEYTINVKVITNKAASSVLMDNNPTNNNNDPNKMLGETILTNVQLMASVDDGILYVPTLGSIVTVMVGTNQIPYVSQFSSIDIVQMDLINEYVVDVGTEDNTSELYMSGMTASLTVIDGDNETSIELNDKITLTAPNGCTQIMDTGVKITTQGNAEISAETLIIIKNDVASLKSLLTDLITNLNSGSNSGGPVVWGTDPAFVTLIPKINGLLGS